MAKTQRVKPKTPYPSFPLTAHPNGQWCKKSRGKVHFVGVWAEPDAAVSRYHELAADLHAGRERSPSVSSTLLTVKELGDEFRVYQMERVASGQIGPRWFEDCRRAIRQFAKRVGVSRPGKLLRFFGDCAPKEWPLRGRRVLKPGSTKFCRYTPSKGLTAADFQRYGRVLVTEGLNGTTGLGVHALTRVITVVRRMFKWAEETGLPERGPRWSKVRHALGRRETSEQSEAGTRQRQEHLHG